jgi:hypothetical protein
VATDRLPGADPFSFHDAFVDFGAPWVKVGFLPPIRYEPYDFF